MSLRHPTSPWTVETTQRARRLAADGVSATDIADELGHGITRNAVIGKLNRLGVHYDRSGQTSKPRPAPPTTRPRWSPLLTPMKKRKDVLVDAKVTPVSFFDVEEHHCRWPIGDPHNLDTFRFCGAPKVDGIAYCAKHAKVAFTAAKPRDAA